MNNSIIIYVIIFLLIGFCLFVFGYLPGIIRRYRIRKLANEFGLVFDDGVDKDIFTSNRSYRKNILSGNIGNHKIEMYDLFSYYDEPVWAYQADYFKRSTVILVDGEKQLLRSLPLCFPSIRRLRNALLKINNI